MNYLDLANHHLFLILHNYFQMNEKINEMKLLIEPEIEEIFDWKCKNKFPYDYVKFGKKGLISEAKIDRIYKKTTK